jgi:UDP-3-O-[3-hydroxymyristoyl] glucosamine N-acyltransferase
MFSVNELLNFLIEKKYIEEKPAEVDGNIRISKFSSLANPTKSSICWAKKLLSVNEIPDCAVLICLLEQKHNPDLETIMIHVAEPRRVFGDIVEKFCPENEMSGIAPSAIIHPSVKIGKNVFIGPNCVIGEGCEIGDNTRIDANVTIYHHVRIGKRCHISSGAVIGADGHGYYLDENKRYKKIRHIGGVTIGDDVDIGANSCVDRGVLDDTTIGNNTKIDNLVQVAHSVSIGSNCILTAGSVITGSAVLGDYCWISPGAVVKNGVILNNETQLGMNSVVYRTVNESNVCLVGDPAKKIKEYKVK